MNRRDMLRVLGISAGAAVLHPQAVAQIRKAKHDLSCLRVGGDMPVNEFPDHFNKLLSAVEQIANAVDNLEVIDLGETELKA